jgi:hypothetical protein
VPGAALVDDLEAGRRSEWFRRAATSAKVAIAVLASRLGRLSATKRAGEMALMILITHSLCHHFYYKHMQYYTLRMSTATDMVGYQIVEVMQMKSQAGWAEDVKRLLRAEMALRGITYEDLAGRLAAIGVRDTAVNLRNRVARGRFSAVFLVQCLRAIGVRALRLNEDGDQQ